MKPDILVEPVALRSWCKLPGYQRVGLWYERVVAYRYFILA